MALKSNAASYQVSFNTFLINVTILKPLKIPEKLCFQGYKMGTLARESFKRKKCVKKQ